MAEPFTDTARAQGISSILQRSLGRPPTAEEVTHWYGNTAGLPEIQAYFDKLQANTDKRNRIAGEFQGILGTKASDTDIEHWLASGATDQQRRDELARFAGTAGGLTFKQGREQEGLFDQYQTARGGQEALPALYDRLRTQQGIPELQESVGAFKGQIFQVKDLLDRLDEDVTSRTRGTFTSEGQRNRIIAAEGADLRNQLGRLGTGLEPVASALQSNLGELSTRFGLSTQQQERELEPIRMRIDAVSDRFARELTGFTSDREYQLTLLMDKLNRERQLADREWELAQTIAAEEREFSRQKQLIKASGGGGGGGGGFSLGGGGISTPSYAPTPVKSSTPSTLNDWVKLINDVRSTGASSWGAAANAIEARYGKIPTGSLADQAFHAIFDTQNAQTAKNLGAAVGLRL